MRLRAGAGGLFGDMSPDEAARQVEQIARELDLTVFTLEREPGDPQDLVKRHRALRRELERLRDALEELARAMS